MEIEAPENMLQAFENAVIAVYEISRLNTLQRTGTTPRPSAEFVAERAVAAAELVQGVANSFRCVHGIAEDIHDLTELAANECSRAFDALVEHCQAHYSQAEIATLSAQIQNVLL